MLDYSLPKRKRQRMGRVFSPPVHSECLYVQLAPKDVAMFKFLLEAEDNLGYISVVDRWSAALKLVFSPHQKLAVRKWLDGAAQTLKFKEIWLDRSKG